MIIWKDIPGYENKYQVSNMGEVRSLPRNGTKKDIVIKSQIIDKDGYCIVKLRNNNCPKMKKVHRLVAETFIPKEKSNNIVDHINGIKNDNRAENLRWVTPRDNVKFGLCGKSFLKVIFIENGIEKTFDSVRAASKELGISRYVIKKDPRFIIGGGLNVNC